MAAKKDKGLTKEQKLELAMKVVRKEYGGTALFRASQLKLEFATTGLEDVDTLIRGFRREAFSVVWGPPGAGKSTLALYTIANEQRQGKVCLLDDAEHRFDPTWAKHLGVNTDELHLMQGSRSMEDNLMSVETLIKTGAIDTVVIDSVTALVAEMEIADKKDKPKKLHDDTTAIQAKRFSEWFRRTVSLIPSLGTTMILVGQGRTQDLRSGMARLGLAGGSALKYYPSTIVKMYQSHQDAPSVLIDSRKKYIGYTGHIILEKTSVCSNQGNEVRLPFVFGKGFDLNRLRVNKMLREKTIKDKGSGHFEWTNEEGKLQKIHGKEKLYEIFEQKGTGT